MDKILIGKKEGRQVNLFPLLMAVALAPLLGMWALRNYEPAPQPVLEPWLYEEGLYTQAAADAMDAPAQQSPDEAVELFAAEAVPVNAGGAKSLDVSLVYQNPELVNGCEATSLSMLLSYYGYDVDKSVLAYDYIPREDFWFYIGVQYGSYPGTAYPGDPATSLGFYCFPEPVTTGANAVLSEQESTLQAYDFSGASERELAQQIYDGNPVMVWVTLDYGSHVTYCDFIWQLPDGETYTPYCNLHCVVLTGVDDDGYEVCDPISGLLYVSRDALFASYQALGSMAVVIQKAGVSG